MQKIKDYIDRFFTTNKMDMNYALAASEIAIFMRKMADANGLFDSITTLFNYGYVKGYRAAKAEMKKGGVVA